MKLPNKSISLNPQVLPGMMDFIPGYKKMGG